LAILFTSLFIKSFFISIAFTFSFWVKVELVIATSGLPLFEKLNSGGPAFFFLKKNDPVLSNESCYE
jgi:hypothetical protein